MDSDQDGYLIEKDLIVSLGISFFFDNFFKKNK